MPNLWKLANRSYDIAHFYSVDGTPATMDVFMGGAWKTILVAGLNGGGRGYYALDITDPSAPKGLWEICSDATLCNIVDTDLGLTFGQPVIAKRHDGTPIVIVSSGYNNVTPGNGGGYLYVLNAATGAVLEKIGTAVGDTTTPSGLAKISGFWLNRGQDNTAALVYGGDLLGNVWRFDMSATPVVAQRIGQAKDGSSRPQSITTKPEVTRFNDGTNVVYVGTGRLLGGSDLGDPANLMPPEPYAFQQSVYAFKDTNADLGNLRLPAAKLVQQVLAVVPASTNRAISHNDVDWTTKNGWYVDLNPANSAPGERVNLDMTLVRGVLKVNTNEPNTQACSEGGNGYAMELDYKSGSYLPGSPSGVVGGQISSALIVGSVFFRTTTGAMKELIRTATGESLLRNVSSTGGGGSGQRVSWRELIPPQ
jgi:type IV pilus assembly protein PilY1